MEDSTSIPDERHKGVASTDLPEFSSEDPFDHFERTMKGGFQAVTKSMKQMSQSVTQSVKKGHMNTTLLGNKTRAYFTYLFEQIIQAAQEERTPRNEDTASRTTKASLGVTKYSQGQTSGHANSSSPKFMVGSPFDVPSLPVQANNTDLTLPPVAALIISTMEKVRNHQLVPLGKAIIGTLPKYQASKTGEAMLPPEPSRRNMHVER
ncbi:hypothetical protein Pyn_21864 [Prunus yedoensis var. nudiflora]|uniref:Uncharacterized protein n=1 Tax=Prunus yedoensis var. nudiflora TaxID=2094558 RepID=A0A314XMQ1_PRUYE|nr:hypothetical protein Pyn_21864 [Prunus yedoensis var. nudiflora]